MISAKMIAPYGLNCALCTLALKAENPCPGCSGPNENKPEFCASLCGIVKCERRGELADWFCDRCQQYPCEDVMEKQTRYTSAYPVRESPMDNLRYIRENGMEQFLALERERWRCKDCGGTICVHDGICSKCGKAYRAEDVRSI